MFDMNALMQREIDHVTRVVLNLADGLDPEPEPEYSDHERGLLEKLIRPPIKKFILPMIDQAEASFHANYESDLAKLDQTEQKVKEAIAAVSQSRNPGQVDRAAFLQLSKLRQGNITLAKHRELLNQQWARAQQRLRNLKEQYT